ncbi:MAG: sulfur transferase domain-containing protein [Acidobacteriota bacterium]
MRVRVLMFTACISAAVGVTVAAAAGAQGVTKETVAGVTNFARLDTTIACAGATTPAAVAGLRTMGYASIIDLRLAGEPGADIEGESAAAKAAGVNFVHLPFNEAAPDLAMVDGFLRAVTAPANQPAFVHCASGNRAAMMWMIKRMLIDKWDVGRASDEAAALGLSRPALKAFALDYAQNHKP